MSARILLYVIMYTLAACTPRPPSTSTTIRLTAQRNDTGTWTAKFGDFQMIIEHKHFNDNSPSEEQDGTWTLKVKHTHTKTSLAMKIILTNIPMTLSLGYDAREYDLETKGYSYFPEVGWVRLNTAHWQWDQARKSCEADGGHLAIPDTLLKIKTFTRILKRKFSIIERAVKPNLTHRCEPFMPESVSIWFPNEPNNADPGEDCVTMHLEGKLRDVPCFYNLPFLCQIY
ncbi:hypothetical protein L9F63_019215 [Diploptera punctata]|uniref:C-type lectin domain-containing protein n=1 Tax=Diploptera punctata TaxID=6984 RepID=A0AAD7ZVN0_DIPPU|nr:hypothetical protein L9F63_019215 [Diploptera punctata]